MHNKILLFVGVVLLSSCASNSQIDSEEQLVSGNQALSDPQATEETATAKDQKICKTRPITGSRFKQKICMTAEEWENMSYETRKMLNKSTRNKVRYDP